MASQVNVLERADQQVRDLSVTMLVKTGWGSAI